jgi:Xaa-Pro aminopeptidase
MLSEAECDRYRLAGAEAGDAVTASLRRLRPEQSELEAAAELAFQARSAGFFPPVVLVGGEARQPVYRHPLPTTASLGRHALLALTGERDGLHVSLTRVVSFGPIPDALARLVRAAAIVDAAMLNASRPGERVGDVFAAASDTYAAQGFPGEWRRHHQGGITGYRGREVFAVPGDPTPLPDVCAVAWNPSVSGGGKSEDTALVSEAGIEILTRTPELPEHDADGLARPAVVEL